MNLRFLLALIATISVGITAHSESLVYEGRSGPGVGKHIVFLAGDHEYRSEETLPALARILSAHHGFKCTVLFTVDPESGEIDPTADNLPGTETLGSADLAVVFLRFKNLPANQMQPIVDYLDRAGPVIGLRTATHAFKIPADSAFSQYDYVHKGADYERGFGRQVLGESWSGHYGKNHVMCTRLDIPEESKSHPILRGVTKPWAQSGGYWTEPMDDCKVLAMAQPLNGMSPDSDVAEGKLPCPGVWIRNYDGKDSSKGRVFATTHGASEDILDLDFRRMIINACFWGCGLEDQITSDLSADFVGAYQPSTFQFDGYRRGIKPTDLADLNSPIMSTEKRIVLPASRTAKRKFNANVDSLRRYECPEWFRDAKFGIYLHWGAYSVVERGEWYARKLYEEGSEDYKYHVETYGHPSEFGYKDFIPMWKAENFDPDALLALFKQAGAKYFTPCAVHHDNFDLWDSKHHRWNAVNMGPKKDLIGMWKTATEKAGLRFGVTTHLSRSYSWLNVANQSDIAGPMKGVPYDGASPQGKGLYPPKHGDTHPRAALNPPKAWRDAWARRVKQLIDDYQPDHLYFDCSVPFRGADAGKTGLQVITHLYNNNPDAVMCIKARPWQGLYAPGIATLDYERGKASYILDEPWQTDDSIGSWGYNKDKPYTTADLQTDKLIDIVSKNGNLLLNIPIRADGTLDETATGILKDMGKWLAVNGEGIYGTRPWHEFGEGHTNEIPHFVVKSPFKSKDIRYTTKGEYLYAFVLDWPGKNQPYVEMALLSPGNYRIGKIESVEMLGHDGEIQWEPHPDGLRVFFPEEKPCDFAYCFKIHLPKR
ncbi:Alpha-L-fucosidase [Planctomycetes bacterium CA13]|uniref:alpha-L-fucosidase n=1 Tax=Novipirellula herctigrandis TaxID=2527986 RepID=A0A5C5ZD92_9BACT|nr:Alpha-L-fucosidase [Planctomycetes bacterium CA13]